tara:strand:+ start:150 stop:488 length:339 start_codon:yes stop_codon:yes gene_type:complete
MPTANVQTQTRLSGIVKSHREVNDILKVNRDKHAKELGKYKDYKQTSRMLKEEVQVLEDRNKTLEKMFEAAEEGIETLMKEYRKLEKENAWLREYFERAEEKEQEDLYADCK